MEAVARAWVAANRRRVGAGLLAAFVLYLAYHIVRLRPTWPDSYDHRGLLDFAIMVSESAFIAAHGRYRGATLADPDSFFFPYAPPATVLFNLYALLPPGVGAWLFWVAKGAAVAAILVCGLKLAEAWRRPERWLVALVALVAADYFVHHDLRQQNVNLIYVAIVAAAVAPGMPAALAGVLIGTSATLKLYSFVFLPWLAWRRRWDALAWAVAVLAVLWLAPVGYYGAETAAALYRDWLGEMVKSGTQAVYDAPAPWITLRHFLARGFGWPPFGEPTRTLLLLLQGAWLAAVAAYAWTTRSAAPGPQRDGAEASVLMLLPLPFSTVLQPTHGTPLLLAFVLIAAAAFDGARGRRQRIVLALGIAAAVALRVAVRDWPLRGGTAYATLLLCLALLAVVVRGREGGAGPISAPRRARAVRGA